MNRANNEIKNHFEYFTELVSREKIISAKTIQLEQKESNAKWLIGQSSIQHETITDDVLLIIERCKRDSKYGIKLRCHRLTDEPFFRFDSDGPAHRNDSPNVPLEEQLVTTPHFNSFQEDGKPIAFKNEILKKENEARAIAEDITFGVTIFCQETNSKLLTGDFPSVIDKVPEIEFGLTQAIDYNNISFE